MPKNYKQEILKKFNEYPRAASIDNIPDDIKRENKLPFRCPCGKEDEKSVTSILRSGPLCKKCTKSIGDEKKLKTLQERYGPDVKNPMDVPEIIESIKESIKKSKGENGHSELGKKLAQKRQEKWNEEQKHWEKVKEDNILLCENCQVEKTLDNFPKGKRKYPTWQQPCRACHLINRNNTRHQNSKNAPIENILKELLYNAKKRHTKKEFSDDCDITVEYLVELYNTQNKKCYLSGRTLVTEINSGDRVSIDRIDSIKGYIKGNIALACWTANNIKQDLSLKEMDNIITDIYNTRITNIN